MSSTPLIRANASRALSSQRRRIRAITVELGIRAGDEGEQCCQARSDALRSSNSAASTCRQRQFAASASPASRPPRSTQPLGEVADPAHRVDRRLERLLGEVQLLPIVRVEHEMAHRRRRDVRLAHPVNGGHVAQPLGHLGAFGQQKRAMAPEAREGLARRRLRLRDLVFVMREDQVDAAAVDVERLAQTGRSPSPSTRGASRDGRGPRENPTRRRLLRLPAWPLSRARNPARSPSSSRPARRARPFAPHAYRVATSLPYGGKAIDREVHRIVVGHVRDLPRSINVRPTRSSAGCSPSPSGYSSAALDAQILTILVKDLGDRFGDLPNGLPLLVRAANDLVVDVGQVHDLTHLPAAQAAARAAADRRTETCESSRGAPGCRLSVRSYRCARSRRRRERTARSSGSAY